MPSIKPPISLKFIKKRRYFYFITVLLYLSLTGCFLVSSENGSPEPPLEEPPELVYDEVAVKRDDITHKLTLSGTFQSLDEMRLNFGNQSGRLKGIYCALGKEVEKGDLLAELDTAGLDYQIYQQETSVEKTEIQYESLKFQQADIFTLGIMELDMEIERIKLDDLKDLASKAVLISPFDGVVVYRARLLAGDHVGVYTPIVSIVNTDKLKFVYSGDNAARIRLGMKVAVTVKSQEYQGEVIMAPHNVPPGGDPEMKSMVVIDVKGLPDEVILGDIGMAAFILSKKENILILPNNVIHFYKGSYYVNILRDGIKKEKPIEMGIRTAVEAEILKGLEEGEKVIW